VLPPPLRSFDLCKSETPQLRQICHQEEQLKYAFVLREAHAEFSIRILPSSQENGQKKLGTSVRKQVDNIIWRNRKTKPIAQDQAQLEALRQESEGKEHQKPSTTQKGVHPMDKDFEGGFGGQEDLEDRYATTSGEH
jgi:hypothetical protein